MSMQDLVLADPRSNSETSRKRLRTSHACDVCRGRKIRRGKTDLVLDGVLRIEKALHELNSTLVQHANGAHATRLVPATSPGPVPASASPCVDSPSVTDAESGRTSHPHPRTPSRGNDARQEKGGSFENAVLDSMHTSTTESVLSWHHFDDFPSLRNDYSSIFQLEQSRPSLSIRQSTIYPYVTSEDVDSILESFEHNVNFWYPTMSQRQIERTRTLINSGVTPEDGIDACVALLTMALGCASQVTTDLWDASSVSEQGIQRKISRRQMGDVYFDAALKKAYVAHLDVTSLSAQCLFYVGDYIAELSASPVSGISRMESSIPLPGSYNTHFAAAEEQHSSLYFLACISMRRLLNRVHQLLYAHETGAALDTSRFPYIVAELQHQLDEWRNLLPPTFAFTSSSTRGSVLCPACRVPSLRDLLEPDVLLAGEHLKQLLQGWQRIVGNARSPSVEQSIRIIHEADNFIREAYSQSPRDGFAVPQRPVEPPPPTGYEGGSFSRT
ncbi:hypothetical protein E4U41_007651 [Claviceps citrina]|nr:hypothetical protein E4U41_007651 [Claviceps citrina]